MITSLVGTNHFLLKRALDKLRCDFVAKHSDLALEQFDAEGTQAQNVIDSVSNVPFLSEKKMVIIKNGQANEDIQNNLEQIIGSVPDWCELIFYEPNIDKRKSYFKVLKSKTDCHEFTELDSAKLTKWLCDEAKNSGGKLSFSDANYLIDRVGANQLMLYNELQKLLTYSPEISREIIEVLCEPTPNSRVFDLLDAAFSGNKKRAQELYQDQIAQRVEPQAILAMLVWQTNLLAIAVAGKGKSASQIAKDSGVNQFPIEKAQRLSNNLTDKDVTKTIGRLYEIDVLSKTKSLDINEALETFLVTI